MGIREHIRSNVVGYIALFLTLTGGTAYALSGSNTVFSDDIVAQGVRSSDVADDTTPFALQGNDIAPDALTGADINEASLGGMGSGILGGQWSPLGVTPNTGSPRAPFGSDSGASSFLMLLPVQTTIRDFRAEITAPPGTGNSRILQINLLPSGGGGGGSTFGCTISGADTTCNSGNASLTVAAGTRIQGTERVPAGSGAPAGAAAFFGYRLVTP